MGNTKVEDYELARLRLIFDEFCLAHPDIDNSLSELKSDLALAIRNVARDCFVAGYVEAQKNE